ncbi:MAG: trigger factor [Bacilli bacterium]
MKENIKKICAYTGLNLGKEEAAEVTEEEIQNEINNLLSQSTTAKEKDGEAVEGDIVNIDFEGFVDGVAFEGGKGEKYDLELGSHSFIPGFEEQLIGTKKDQDIDVKVTFPENYQAENLKGKEAIFKCTVHAVKEKAAPELNNEFVAQFGIDTVEHFKEAVKNKLQSEKNNKAINEYIDRISLYLVDNSEIEVTDEEKETRLNDMIKYYENSVAQYGSTLEAYLSMSGMTIDQFREKLIPEAEKSVKIESLYAYIAEKENITVLDEEIDREFAYMKNQYQMSDEQFEKFCSERKDDLRNELANVKVSQFLSVNNK